MSIVSWNYYCPYYKDGYIMQLRYTWGVIKSVDILQLKKKKNNLSSWRDSGTSPDGN